MCEKDYSDEECATGLKDQNESAPSHPEGMTFTEENQHHAGAYAHPLPTPSSVTFLPSFDAAPCCPSTVVPLRYPDERMGVHMRGSNPGSFFMSFSWMMPSRLALTLRPETPLTASACAMTGEEKKNSSEMTSGLCAALDRTSLDLPKLFHPCTTGEMEEGARSTTADGFYRKCNEYPNNCNTTENEAKLETAADDDDSSLGDVISLHESSPGTSREIMAASAANMSSVQDVGGLWSCPPERNARGVEQDCRGGHRRKVKLNNCDPPMPGDTFPFNHWDEQFEIGFLNALFSDEPDPLDAQLHAAVAGHADPSNAEQSAENGDNLRWASCKICWRRFWKFIFIPCGHGTCKPCYRQLITQMCPFCRQRIKKIVEARLEYS